MTRYHSVKAFIHNEFWCTRTNTCSNHGDIRLVNGAGPYEGRVEVCYSGEWKTVCQHWWSNSDAKVVCAQLNYLPQGT